MLDWLGPWVRVWGKVGWGFVVALAVVTLVLLGGCGGDVERSAGSAGESAAGAGTDSGGVAGSSFEGGAAGNGGAAGGEALIVVECPDGSSVGVSGPACGDGRLDAGEMCDDGNVTSGDGCSSQCRITPGFICPEAGEPCLPCGNCEVDEGEGCDDGNQEDGDGCSARCQVEDGYRCDIPAYACIPLGECGDGQVTMESEVCDDGNAVDGDGCSADCAVVEAGYLCLEVGEPCARVSSVFPHCGDRVVQTDEGESCDDGFNDARLDGCSVDCQLPRCGDGQVQPAYGEECDDGVNDGGYGQCDPSCQFPLMPEPVDCTLISIECGDGIIDSFAGETCDDGINDGMDGRCSTDCTPSRDGSCGDGVLEPAYEECDDGNIASCDGCGAMCQVEVARDGLAEPRS